MPPDPNSFPPGPPAGKPRRRPDQGAGSGWVGIVIVLLLLAFIVVYSFGSKTQTVTWSDFWAILSKDYNSLPPPGEKDKDKSSEKVAQNLNLKKVIYQGKGSIYFEVKNPDALPQDIQDHYKK